jgi:hypothetical protein
VSIRRSVSPDYFRVIGTRLVSGRVFRDTDAIDSPPVVIVSEQTATEYWPDGEAVGRTLEWQSGRGQPITAEVIGVVDDLHSLSTTARPDGGRTVYTPLYADGSLPFQNRFLIVRGNSNPAPLAPALGNLIRSTYSSSQAVTGANRLEDFIARELGPARFGSFLLGSFAVIAFVIALIGIYGVASCAVARRTYEMGVRMALGARRRDIFTMVLTESMAVVLLGVLLGVGVAVGGNRIVESFLFQTESIDAGVFGLVVTVFIVVALAASSIPARRAARSDPATALRAE